MSFKEILKDNLKGKISDSKLNELPSSHQLLGGVCLIKLKDELLEDKKIIGAAILELIPRVKTVCLINKIEGELRWPKVEIIAGNGTEVLHKENKCFFYLDAAEIMWSKGNQEEKRRLINLVKDGETIIDCFAGVGYWSIPLGVNKDVKVYAIELNPKSYDYLKKNIELNKVEDKVIPIEGDCREEITNLKGNRIIMGYFPGTINYLGDVLRGIENGWIHYHDICDKEKESKLLEEIKRILFENNFELIERNFKVVKKYSPNSNHIVADLRVKRKLS